jgi:hypothetical protein
LIIHMAGGQVIIVSERRVAQRAELVTKRPAPSIVTGSFLQFLTVRLAMPVLLSFTMRPERRALAAGVPQASPAM